MSTETAQPTPREITDPDHLVCLSDPENGVIMPVPSAKLRWFGNLLDWQRDAQAGDHVTWHKGQARRITKLTRRQADEMRTHKGWHIYWPDGEDGRPGHLGPNCGRTLPWAYTLAEAWIVCPYEDMMAYPRLWLAIAGGGVAWRGRTIWPDRAHGELIVRQGEAEVGELYRIRPVWTGSGSTIEVASWDAHVAGQTVESGSTWRELIAALDSRPSLHAVPAAS